MPASKRQKKGLGEEHDDVEPQFAIPMPKARGGSGDVYDFPVSDDDGERARGAGTKNANDTKRKRGRPPKSSAAAKTKKQQQQQEETQEVIYLATPRSQKRLPAAPPPEGQPRRLSNWRPPAVETEQEEDGQQDQSEEAGNLLNSLVGNVAAGPQMMTPPMTGSAGSPGTGKKGRAVNLRPRKVSGAQQQTLNQVEQHQSIDNEEDEEEEDEEACKGGPSGLDGAVVFLAAL